MSQPTHLSLVSEIIRSLSKFTFSMNTKATGQAVIEKDNDVPVIVMYAAYQSGDALCWFIDDGKAHLYGLVNDSVKHIKSCLIDELPGLQKDAMKLGKKFEKKKK